MEGMVYIEKSPIEIDLYFEKVKMFTVIAGSVVMHPEAADVFNAMNPKRIFEMSKYVAPFIVQTMKNNNKR